MQPLTPSLVDSIVRKCLAKDADDRWQTAADLGSALRWAAAGALAATSSVTATVVTPQTGSRRAVRGAVVAVGIVAALAIGVTVGRRYLSTAAPRAATVRFEVQTPADVMLSLAPVASAAQPALSPDGRRLAYVAARRRGVSQLWVRPLDSVEAQPLLGTEGASFPFWSPDSRFLAFFAAGKLKRIDTVKGARCSRRPSMFGRVERRANGFVLPMASANSRRLAIRGSQCRPLVCLRTDLPSS